jgi:hypothetical protein
LAFCEDGTFENDQFLRARVRYHQASRCLSPTAEARYTRQRWTPEREWPAIFTLNASQFSIHSLMNRQLRSEIGVQEEVGNQ